MASLLDWAIKVSVDDQASGAISKIGAGIGGAMKASVAAIGAASAGIVALGKIGLDYNTQMETYTTNFETMLGNEEAALAKVEELKRFAASTPLSMDDLAQGTQTLLAFGVASNDSTRLLKMLGDVALGDAPKMQRLATAFGKATAQGKVTGDTVQQMVDAGFNPLIAISQRTGESMEELQKRMSKGNVSVAELEQALIDVTSSGGQFAGGMEKASHTTVGLMSTLQDNARALVGEVFMPISEGLLNNVLPTAISSIDRLTTAFREDGLDGLIDTGGQIIGELIAGIAEELPGLVQKGFEVVQSVVSGITEYLPNITQAAVDVITTLVAGVTSMLPSITQAGLDIITTLATGIGDSLPSIITSAVTAITGFAETITNPENLTGLAEGALAIINGLVDGIVAAIPALLESLPKIVTNIVDFFSNTENIENIATSGATILGKLISGIVNALTKIPAAAKDIVTKITTDILTPEHVADVLKTGADLIGKLISGIANSLPDIAEAGKQVVSNIIDGIAASWSGLTSWFGDLWSNLFGNRSVDVNVNGSYSDDGSKKAGRFAIGNDFVPYDNYPALLHRGEAVLTAREADQWRRGAENQQQAAPQNLQITIPLMLDGEEIGRAAYNYAYDEGRRGAMA